MIHEISLAPLVLSCVCWAGACINNVARAVHQARALHSSARSLRCYLESGDGVTADCDEWSSGGWEQRDNMINVSRLATARCSHRRWQRKMRGAVMGNGTFWFFKILFTLQSVCVLSQSHFCICTIIYLLRCHHAVYILLICLLYDQ